MGAIQLSITGRRNQRTARGSFFYIKKHGSFLFENKKIRYFIDKHREQKIMNDMRVIFVDWNKTLSNSCFWDVDGFFEPEKLDHLNTWLFKGNSSLVADWMRGKASSQDILTKLSHVLDIPVNTLTESLITSCYQMTYISNTILPLIQKVRNSGIKVVLATDNMDVFSKHTVPHMKLENIFDDLLISSDIGAIKTDETCNGNLSFFSPYLKKNGFSLKEAILIDDNVTKKDFFESKGLKFLAVTQEKSAVQHFEMLDTLHENRK
jgi:FMN phosphatase YigB (HAD superfamily)